MADKTVTQLTELTAVDQNDILMIVDDPSGTPISKKATAKNVLLSAHTCTANTSVAGTDEIVLIADPGGTPAVNRATVAQLFKAFHGLTANTAVLTTDEVCIIDDPSGSPAAQRCTVANLLAKIWVSAPANAGAAGTAGQIAYDASYLYVCTGANTWRRISHATW